MWYIGFMLTMTRTKFKFWPYTYNCIASSELACLNNFSCIKPWSINYNVNKLAESNQTHENDIILFSIISKIKLLVDYITVETIRIKHAAWYW